jgi:hypothetical protein
MKRPGYYVEGRWFRDNIHQARARAAFLAQEYGRGIDILKVTNEDELPHLVLTAHNGKKERTA